MAPLEGSREGERAAAPGGLRLGAGPADSPGGRPGNLPIPSHHCRCIDHVRGRLEISERRACRVPGQHRSTRRRAPHPRADEKRWVADRIGRARRQIRYGSRRIATRLRDAGGRVHDQRVERRWRREGRKVPARPRKRSRLWLRDGSGGRLRAERVNPLGSYDFLPHRTEDGRAFRRLNVRDEFRRESLAIRVRRTLSSSEVVDVRSDRFLRRGVPAPSVPTPARSSSPRPCGDGSLRSAPVRPSFGRGPLGRTDPSKASTHGCGTNSGTERSSPP